MPTQQTMGLDTLSNPNLVFKRKYRWSFGASWNGGIIAPTLVKSASRPNLEIGEQEINYMHGKMWIPGKPEYQTMEVVYFDVGGNIGQSSIRNLYSWLASVYNFTGSTVGPRTYTQASKMGDGTNNVGYAGVGNLELYDGCGSIMEQWQILGMWPKTLNFGDLAYDSNEEVTVSVTFRYHDVRYQMFCPNGTIQPICAGC